MHIDSEWRAGAKARWRSKQKGSSRVVKMDGREASEPSASSAQTGEVVG